MRALICISLIITVISASAQIDSTVQLHEVNITTIRSIYQSGLRIENIDSSEIKRLETLSLDQLLENNTAITIKDYGHGQLSTITLRGGSTYHTAVLWNGFSISSPLHGLTDLTLADNLFFDQTKILYGGASTLWGSGAVSGSIYLENTPQFGNGFGVVAGAVLGSYSDFTQFAEVHFGKNKYYGSVKYIGNDNKNDYAYYDENSELQNQTHSHLKHHSIFLDNYLKTGKYSTLNFRLWNTNFDREIAPGLQQVSSDANQKDKNLRISAEWKKVTEDFQVNVRTAFFREEEQYKDIYLPEPSNNNCSTFISEALAEKRFNLHHLQFGINNTTNLVDSSVNLQAVTLNRLAVFLLYHYYSQNKKLDASVSGRKEISAAGNSPFLYSAGINYNFIKSLMARSSFSRVFRYPTLNDLYWTPGGNKDLKPENGYSAEAGIQFDANGLFTQLKSSHIVFNLTYYYREMNDWIIWYPSASSLWTPQNLLKVKSRGLETSVNYIYNHRTFSFTAQLSYNYTLSTNEQSIHQSDESYQKQLIYVPLHAANLHVSFNYKNFSFSNSYCYTGYRYTTSDNTNWLNDYSIINTDASQLFKLKNILIKAFIRVNNLTNTNYQSVENHPMPLRTFTGGVSITVNN